MNLDEFRSSIYRDSPKLAIKDSAALAIKKARTDAGLTQHELAKKMGTKQENIARAESGKHEPSMSFMYRVAQACGKKFKVARII